MDFTGFYTPQYSTLTNTNIQSANNAFQLNPAPPNVAQQTAQHQQHQQLRPNASVAQLAQSMFYLDPFDAKLESSADLDHASYSNDSDVFLDDLDDLSRTASVAQNRRSTINATHSHQRNHSPQNIQPISQIQPTEFDLAGQDFFETQTQNGNSMNGNSTKRKAQNRAAQRAFRERKERHVKDLEAKVAALEERTAKMADENSRLKHRLAKFESENNMLKGSNITFTFPQFEKDGNYSPPLSDHGSFTDFDPNRTNGHDSGQHTDITMFTLDSLVSQPSVLKPISPVSISDTAQHAESTTPVSARAQNLMMQYHDMNSNHSIPVGDDEHHFFDCPKVWEKIVSHPRFDEIDDVEALCQELNAKVRICVDRDGPSVDRQELEKALEVAIEEVACRKGFGLGV